ncbi:MAG: DUF190 domain-containing protein [Legionella sp.]|nr:DUF190 domain-containing protein [Legionella sp.]
MNTMDVLVVRIYLMESANLLNKTIKFLRKTAKIRGLTVFRGIEGFGDTGKHVVSLIDLSLDLPIVIEFFDEKEKVESTLEALTKVIKPMHIIFWEAKGSIPCIS